MDTFLHVGLSNAVLATALALPAAAASRLCRRPALAHCLWLLVLLKLLTPPLWRIPLPWPAPVPEPAAAAPVPPLIPGERVTEAPEPPPSPEAAAEEPPASAPTVPLPVVLRPVPWKPVSLSVWLLGSLGWWMLAGWRLYWFRRLLRAARPAPADVQEQGRRLAGLLGLKRCPGAWFVPAAVSPMLLALGRSPRLLLPIALWGRLSAEQRDTLLAHEFAHLRRGDPWVRRLELVVLGLYWWHPVAWWARRALQEAEEQCCDAWVVWALPQAAPDYATALVETVAFLSRAGSALPVGASGTGQVPLLQRRLTMILRGTPPRSLSRPAFWLIVGLGAVLLPLTPLGARPDPPAPVPGESSEDNRKSDPSPPPDSPVEKAHILGIRGLGLPWWQGVCGNCHANPHQVPAAPAKSADYFKQSHDEVIRLLEEVRRSRASLRDMEARLQLALKRLEKAQPPQPRRPAGKDLDVPQHAGQQKVTIGHPFLKIYSVPAGNAVNLAKMLQEVYKSSTVTRITAGGSSSLIVYARPEEHIEIAKQITGLDNSGTPPRDPARLKELEKKLDQLQKEMEDLRRELRPGKQARAPMPPADQDNVWYSRQKKVRIPFWVSPNLKVSEMLLYVSDNKGASYQRVASARPTDRDFRFDAPTDGWYWFAVQTRDVSGRLDPEDLSGLRPLMKVCVDTKAPRVDLQAPSYREGAIDLRWEVDDENLDPSSLRLDYRLADEVTWHPVVQGLIARCNRMDWKLPPPTPKVPLEVRLQARDKAGNSIQGKLGIRPPYCESK